MPNVLECFCVLFRVLDQYVNHKLVLAMLGGQIRCLLVVASLSAHGDSCVKVKLEISRRLDESLELLNVFQLCVAV